MAEAVAPLLKSIKALEETIKKLKKNSSNSSKPPSSDIVKPPKKTGKGSKRKRKRGGQPGNNPTVLFGGLFFKGEPDFEKLKLFRKAGAFTQFSKYEFEALMDYSHHLDIALTDEK